MAAPHSRRSAVGRLVGILVGKVKGLRWDSKLTGAVGEGPGRDQRDLSAILGRVTASTGRGSLGCREVPHGPRGMDSGHGSRDPARGCFWQ